MSDALKDAAAEIRRRIEESVATIKAMPQMADITAAIQTLNGLEDLMKEPRTSLAEVFGLAVSDTARMAESVPLVRFDEFYGMEPLEGAKAYLKKRADARPFQEIVDALRAGGCKLDNEEKLKGGLSRSTLDIVKIGDRYGWLDNYPDVKTKRWKGFRKAVGTDDTKPSEEISVKKDG